MDFENNLNSAINRLREALGDPADRPRFIETLPRRGYRFIAPVERLGGFSPALAEAREAGGTDSPGATGAPRTAPRIPARLALAAGTLVAALAVLLVGWKGGWWRAPRPGDLTSPRIQSIAVLPLENLSGDPAQEYLVDGMTEALTTELAQIGALRVISRTSAMRYKGTKKPLAEIARELKVEAVVEGAVLRSDDRVRITAQLIHAPTDQHLWAASYERDLRDVLELQKQVARARPSASPNRK